jgi:hypothetical protein
VPNGFATQVAAEVERRDSVTGQRSEPRAH